MSSEQPIRKHLSDASSGGGGNKQANTVLMNTPFGGIDNIREVYFIGIGGIGMSALAKFFHSRGVKVSGYDKTPTNLTREMETNGIAIHYEENVDVIPKNAELVVYTPAVPKDHKELLYYQQHGNKVVKRSDVLQMITESSFNICIAGTHGKTTITTMVGHILRDSGFGGTAFLGGISVNYGTNFWAISRFKSTDNKNVCIVEADEYDRSFLKLNPDIAVISAMDADHLDIYGTADAVEQGFIDFSSKVKPGGLLISKFGMPRGKELKGDKRLTYSLDNKNGDVYADNIRMMNGSYEFDVIMPGNKVENVRLNMGGLHNIENVVAAITVASSLKISNEKIKAGVESFKGVKRRFEYIIKNEKMVFIDDYAHHPEELRALITGAKTLFKGKKCTVIFQPHLYSRTKDQADGFAEVLGMADEIILLPIYPARELPMPGVSSEMITERMNNKNSKVMNRENILDWIKSEYRKKIEKEFGVLITAGAGDIDTMVEPIRRSLNWD
ncbi:MAG: UDP-N-acetylmuramate--L-alanine ligase [Chitinophagaceae bacterium]